MRSGYRLEILVRVANSARLRTARAYARAQALAVASTEIARDLEAHAAALRHEMILTPAVADETSVGAHRLGAAQGRALLIRRVEAVKAATHATQRAAAALDVALELKRSLVAASSSARQQNALKAASVKRMLSDKRHLDERQAESESLDIWNATRFANGD